VKYALFCLASHERSDMFRGQHQEFVICISYYSTSRSLTHAQEAYTRHVHKFRAIVCQTLAVTLNNDSDYIGLLDYRIIGLTDCQANGETD